MTENEMTEAEIMKALECCQTQYDRNCIECPYQKYKSMAISAKTCSSELRKDLIDLKALQRKNLESDAESRFHQFVITQMENLHHQQTDFMQSQKN